MTSLQPAAPSPQRSSAAADKGPGLLRTWWIADRGALLRMFALLLALVSYAFLWPRLIEAGGAGLVIRNMALHLFVAAWLMVVTIGIRSVGSREVLTAFLLGTFLVPALVFFPLTPVISRIGSQSNALAVWWVPPMEEAAILAGVALIAWRMYRRRNHRPGVLDLMLIGWSVGSGYAIHEDALYGRLLANMRPGTISAAFGDMYGWIYPTFALGHQQGGTGATTYHAGSGVFYGLVLGVALLLLPRVRGIIWLVPAAWLYGAVDHAAHNYHLNFGLTSWRYVTGTGHVIAVILIGVVPILLLVEYGRRRNTALHLPPVSFFGVFEAARRGTSAVNSLVRKLAVGHYHRGRNGAVNAAWRDKRSSLDVRSVVAWSIVAFAEPTTGSNAAPDHRQDSRQDSRQDPGQDPHSHLPVQAWPQQAPPQQAPPQQAPPQQAPPQQAPPQQAPPQQAPPQQAPPQQAPPQQAWPAPPA